MAVQIDAFCDLHPWLAKQRTKAGALSRWIADCCAHLRSATATPPKEPADYRREANIPCKCSAWRITGGLEHPGVVPVYGLCQYPDGRPYYAMRFIRGRSLEKEIERIHKSAENIWDRPMAFRHLLTRFLEVCNAVDYAQFAFTLRGTFRPPLPANFVVNLYRKTHKVNSDKVRVYAQGAWLTFEAGELLFRGATGGIRSGDEAVELSMQFAASENAFLEGIIDGAIDDFNNSVKGILKRGWEYLWFRYEDNVIDDKFVPKAVQAFVGEVYPTTELAPLLTPFNG